MAALAALAVPVAGCGTTQKEKERDPLGDGSTKNPNVEIDSVDALRTSTVEIQKGNFLPSRVGLKLDNNVKFVNRDARTYTLVGRTTKGTVSFRTARLKPQESLKREFLSEGDVEVTIKGSPEKMTIGVFY